jgi:predicted choloylglycine hydrolase
MPELLGLYESACELVGDDGLSPQIISQYRPPAVLHGCTQAVWLGAEGPALVRNYDFPLEVVSDHFQSTRWLGREVISKAQRPWGGCLDGMNADGLVASVTFGGCAAQGQGFSIILIARYVLETCSRVRDAVDALCRIPVALSQNVTVLDRSGAYATVYLTPERAPLVAQTPVCANHQEPVDLAALTTAALRSIGRQSAALRALESPDVSLAQLQQIFLRPPLYSRDARSPTVYSAVYRPAELTVDYLWPDHATTQRIGSFTSFEYVHDYGQLETSFQLCPDEKRRQRRLSSTCSRWTSAGGRPVETDVSHSRPMARTTAAFVTGHSTVNRPNAGCASVAGHSTIAPALPTSALQRSFTPRDGRCGSTRPGSQAISKRWIE